MKSSAALVVKCSDAITREALGSVLSPDNKGGPEGLRFSATSKGSILSFKIDSESSSSALSTVLALLGDISLFSEVWLLSRSLDA